ncbi:WD40/YVTN/BNR-like repeat-containing protein [Kordiimonas aquimaris]|uniref:WD40/YVTN/BNR-like repeat-containing protein n=1 Tax=Kordiimonas aquimaris TaxID=707591 RepID=UPI0021D14D4A|nr:hypothetical protein [Kordiimonas aquimaris]
MSIKSKIAALMAATTLVSSAALMPALAETKEKDFFVEPAFLDGLEFRNIGPFRGGRVTTVAGTTSDKRVYYMGATGGGVWKTTNAGNSWKNVSDKYFKMGSVGALAVAPSDPNVVVAGMGESPFRGVASSHGDGVYISRDAGKTWENVGLKESRQVSTVHIHPTNPDVIWVAVQGSPWAPTEERGVYKTTDGGKTWNKTLFVDENSGAIDLSIDPNNPRILYAAMWDTDREPWLIRSGGPGSGIWKSVDGGETWTKTMKGLPEEVGKIGVVASPAKSDLVWAIVEAKEKGGLYKSTNGGESWTFVNGDRRLHARSWYYMHVFADPQDENKVFVLNAPYMQSIDGGKTFTQISVPHGDTHDLWINPEDTDVMINANDGGGTVSLDGGESWSTVYNQPTQQFYRINADNNFAYRVYAGQQDNSTIALLSRAPDGSIGPEDYHAVAGCESGFVGLDRDNPRYAYSGCYLGQIGEYDFETETVRDVRAYPETSFGKEPRERKYRFNWNAPIVVSQHNPTAIYHAGNKVLKSTDRGVSWTEFSPDLTRNDPETQGFGGGPITNEVSENYNTIAYLTDSVHDAGTFWAGSDDGLVHVTRDNGATWENVTPRGVGVALVNAIDVSPHDPATAYVAITRYKMNDHTPMIYKTTNYGKRWTQIADGIPDGDFVRVVREDTERKGMLYAGTETGLYVSFDDGKAWQPMQLNLPHVPITDIKVHGKDLLLSTQGRGFWVLDDIAPLRQISDEVDDTPATLFAPSTAYHVTTAGSRNGGPTAPNPPQGALLYYALDTVPEEGVSIEILDDNGAVIRTLKSDEKKGGKGGGNGSAYTLPIKAGLNRGLWDLRTDALKKIDGLWSVAGGADGKVDGYIVAPGTYTARMTAGDNVAEQSFDVSWDPRLDVSASDINRQVDLAKRTYAMLDELQRSVIAMRTAKKQAKVQSEAHGDVESIKSTGEAAIKAIEAWESGLINVDREFFQDVLNWPDKLHSDLQFLAGVFNGGIPPVNAGAQQRFDDLVPVFDAAMRARDAVVSSEIAAFNEAFAASGRSAIAAPDFAAE